LEFKINVIKVRWHSEIPKKYTGIVEYSNDDKVWYLNGLCHRVNGPASELLDRDEWYINGKLHRVNGPAIEYHDESSHLNEWFLNDKEYSQEEWFEMLSEENKLEMIWNLR
jgi:hypothetical protein